MDKKFLKLSLLTLFLNFTAILADSTWSDYVGGQVEGTGIYAGKKYILRKAIDTQSYTAAVFYSKKEVNGRTIRVAVKVEISPLVFSQVENENKILEILCKGKTEEEAISLGFVYKHDFMGTAKMYKKTEDREERDCKVLVETLFNLSLDKFIRNLRPTKMADLIIAISLSQIFTSLENFKRMDIIHGDLALENVGVIKKGELNFKLVLFDFGLSVVYSEDKNKKIEDHIYIGNVEGKHYSRGIKYCQPLPSIQCEARDFWHDLDAFGTLIYELMGSTPWNTDRIEELFVKRKFDEMIADMKALRENCTHEDIKKYIQATKGSKWIESVGETARKIKAITTDRKAAEFTTTGPLGNKYSAIRQILVHFLENMIRDFAASAASPSSSAPNSPPQPISRLDTPTLTSVPFKSPVTPSSKTFQKPSPVSPPRA